MRPTLFAACCCWIFLVAGPPARGSASREIRRREVAVTFDDLPAVNQWEPTAVKRMTQKLLRSLTTNGVPATGFVTESRLSRNGQVDPVLVAALQLWLAAGLELGNHSYSHFDLNKTPLSTYQADIIRGEAITRRLLQPKVRKLRYFRHPYLHIGPTRATRAAVEQFLTRRGYGDDEAARLPVHPPGAGAAGPGLPPA